METIQVAAGDSVHVSEGGLLIGILVAVVVVALLEWAGAPRWVSAVLAVVLVLLFGFDF